MIFENFLFILALRKQKSRESSDQGLQECAVRLKKCSKLDVLAAKFEVQNQDRIDCTKWLGGRRPVHALHDVAGSCAPKQKQCSVMSGFARCFDPFDVIIA